MKKLTVLHLSFDYPDGNPRSKPKAVENLVSQISNYNHIIVSLNRIENPLKESLTIKDNVIIVNGFYLKYGIFLNFFLKRIARKIISFLKTHHYQFDIIHSHKITFEGIIGHQIAQHFYKKHVVTIRGNTDLKVIAVKRMSRAVYKNILDHSAKVISVAPWVVDKIHTIFQKKYDITILPNVSFIEKVDQKPNREQSNCFALAMVFDRNYHRIKNISRTFQAFKKLTLEYPFLTLKILGDGRQKNKIVHLINKYGLQKNIELPGFQDRQQLMNSFRNSIAYVMPSFPETFGLVYLEALSAGIPILHSENAGVDGYFDSGISLKANHKSVDDIYKALKHLYLNQQQYKNNVAEFIQSADFTYFHTQNIVNEYYRIIESVEPVKTQHQILAS